ncbi:hypothetical protein [Kocuria sp.]|uniref:hypothetical protein n=1 Tax=Kocuria sp. TaxID=1871328 RepID=UPI0026DEE74E|nr:hypothetical protein [Kocuria sp.]MDO5619658.1 hypothetical protein [Kocuria sp.]
MRIFTPIAATAAGACLTGMAGGLLALSTAQSRLPSIMAWLMKPEPDLDGKVVLVSTGIKHSGDHDPAQAWRKTLTAEHHGAVLIDLRLPAGAGEKQHRHMHDLAQRIPADLRREFTPDGLLTTHR